MPFDPVDPRQSLPALEKGILRYWKEEDVFKRSIHKRSQGEAFSFYDGPPFATGLPHYGHLLAGTIKDVIPRYQTMRGQRVERRFGWDCHGLPVENLIEQEQGLKSRKDIEAMGVRAFNELCKASVQRYTKEWRETVERMGRWVDMDYDYRTMDPEYMESIWWVFSELNRKGLIYEGHKSMHVCPRCVTPLSNFEVTLGYKEITDHAVTVQFALEDKPKTFVLAWTTTPWTLPGNLFLAVHPKTKYARLSHEGNTYFVAENLIESVFHDKKYHVEERGFPGSSLINLRYKPLFPYFAKEYAKQNAFRIVPGDFVTTDEGTGVVHIATGFGEDDYQVGKRENVSVLQHVTMEGRFTDAVKDFAGELVKPADDPAKTDRKVAAWLESHGKLFSAAPYPHSYPHCWRCDTPLLNYATSSWFVAVTKIKEDLLTNNAETEWVPEHIRDGRFGKWLENARDWAISRNRYWGTPLPIWRESRNQEPGTRNQEIVVIGSRDDLIARQRIRFTKVTVLRHGESEGNLTPIYQGNLPGTSLTREGKSQAKEAGRYLRDRAPDVIYCSPLARARETAEIIGKMTGAQVIVDDRLREVTFSEYEGKTIDFSDLSFVQARRAHKLDTRKPESIYHFEGMETWESVRARIGEFMRDIIPRHRSEHVLVVTHADPLMNIRHFFTQEDPVKLSHQPYPMFSSPETYYWDHDREAQLDLHKDTTDEIAWIGSPSPASIELTLVRHGETEWNKDGLIQGHVEIPLDDRGREQAETLAKKLRGKASFDAVLASDLPRAVETAEILAEALGIGTIEKWNELRERDVGSWGGKDRADVARAHPFVKESNNYAVHHETPEGGESLSAFLRRGQRACERILREFPGKRVLVVAHSGSIQAMRVFAENLSYNEALRMTVPHADPQRLSLHPLVQRIPEVLDCWFESGSMPYAQSHYPFAFAHRNEKRPPGFPADFIAEGLDQTRGWFYTLMVLSTALFNDPAFRHCVVNGIVLAEDGKKMSKRLKNYPEPTEVAERQGADAVRFTLMHSPAVCAEDLRFSETLVEQTVRSVLLPLWNAYSFFVTYANACPFEPVVTRRTSDHPLDRFIRAEVQDLTNRMTAELEHYDLSATCEEIFATVEALTNWYIRLSRKRFAGKDTQHDALTTLYDVLMTLSQLLAPFCPFIADAIYLNLVPEDHVSVHLSDWPDVRELTADEKALLEKTRLLKRIVSLGLTVRAVSKARVRQPLAAATIAVPHATFSNDDLVLLRQELNVKEVSFTDDPSDVAEPYAFVDARKVGPRLKSRVQDIIAAGKAGDFAVEEDGHIRILEETFAPAEVWVSYRGREGHDVAAEGGIVVALDTRVTEELKREGLARELIRTIQVLRKESGLTFTDRIALSIAGADEVKSRFGAAIAEEVRAELRENDGSEHKVELEGHPVTIRFQKL